MNKNDWKANYILRGEYFLTNYLWKLGCFDPNLIESGYNVEGYFDNINLTATEIADDAAVETRGKRRTGTTSEGNTVRHEFAFTPNFGFLASPEYLINNCELKLSFDRSNWQTSVLEYDTVTTPCTYLEIKDCVAIAEYKSSPAYRNYFNKIEKSPIVYKYDECECIIKSMPINETEISFHNLRGGPTPDYVFMGILTEKQINGDKSISSTRFTDNNVTEMDITLDGSSVCGYPVHITQGSPVYPLYKFLDVTGRLYDNNCGNTLDFNKYLYNWLWSHKFEVKTTSNGWLGVKIRLSEAFDEPMKLVVWSIYNASISIDKYHQVRQLN